MSEVKIPYISIAVLVIIMVGCILGDTLYGADPYYMSFSEVNKAPGAEHIFGTDTMGRDLFSVMWCGGRVSIIIGILSALISTFVAVIYGTAAGLVSERIDDLMMRFAEILMSVPQLLLVMFIQAIMGEANVVSIAFAIGITGWMAVAKMARSEVRRLRYSGFIMAARTMGGGFFYILRRHLLPNFFPAIMYMIVTNIGGAIGMEATLSFLGLGLPMEIISWGSLMSLSQRAMLTGAWWVLIIPGTVLVITLICITEIGEYVRVKNRRTL